MAPIHKSSSPGTGFSGPRYFCGHREQIRRSVFLAEAPPSGERSQRLLWRVLLLQASARPHARRSVVMRLTTTRSLRANGPPRRPFRHGALQISHSDRLLPRCWAWFEQDSRTAALRQTTCDVLCPPYLPTLAASSPWLPRADSRCKSGYHNTKLNFGQKHVWKNCVAWFLPGSGGGSSLMIPRPYSPRPFSSWWVTCA